MNSYTFTANLWRYNGPSSWHFITLPKAMSAEIKTLIAQNSPGWGSLEVRAKIGNTQWKTSLFFDTKCNAYLLPIKADVRKKEKLVEGDSFEVRLEVD